MELGFDSISENPTYSRTNLTIDEILPNHKGVLEALGNNLNKNNHTNKVELDLPYLN